MRLQVELVAVVAQQVPTASRTPTEFQGAAGTAASTAVVVQAQAVPELLAVVDTVKILLNMLCIVFNMDTQQDFETSDVSVHGVTTICLLETST